MNYKKIRKENLLKLYGHEPTSLDDLARCVIAMIETHTDRKKRDVKVAGFSWEIHYDPCISNTHYAPVGGETNWGGEKKHIPRNYPGWYGRVWIRYEKDYDMFGSDPFESTLTYPGTGGAGEYDGPFKRKNGGALRSWDYRFFEDDFPLVTIPYKGEMMLDMLENGRLKRYEHTF